jgi:hypothetical protein
MPKSRESAAPAASPGRRLAERDPQARTAKLRDLDLSGLSDFVRDLLFERGAAATAIDRRRQELPYHPLLAAHSASENGLQDRIARVGLSLLQEAAVEPWELPPLHYLFTFIEEAPIRRAADPLEALVRSGVWLRQPSGAQRQMLALRTLLGLGWYGEPNFWLEQHQRLGRAYPELTFRAIADHGLEQAFSRLPALAPTPREAKKILRLFPTLIAQYSLAAVKALARRAVAELIPETAAEFENWFRGRNYGSLTEEDLRSAPKSKSAVDLATVADALVPRMLEAMGQLNDRDYTVLVSHYGLEVAMPRRSSTSASYPTQEAANMALWRARRKFHRALERLVRSEFDKAEDPDERVLLRAIKLFFPSPGDWPEEWSNAERPATPAASRSARSPGSRRGGRRGGRGGG